MINACLPFLPPSWIVYLPSLPSLISWPYARAFGAIYHHGLSRTSRTEMRSPGRCNEALSCIQARYLLVIRNYQEYHLLG